MLINLCQVGRQFVPIKLRKRMLELKLNFLDQLGVTLLCISVEKGVNALGVKRFYPLLDHKRLVEQLNFAVLNLVSAFISFELEGILEAECMQGC